MNGMFAVVGVVVIGIAAGLVAIPIARRRELAARRDGTFPNGFVFVEDDGSARELSTRERAHINAEYTFGDGNAPYVKAKYRALTPDGRMHGYLARSDLPWRVRVKPAPPDDRAILSP